MADASHDITEILNELDGSEKNQAEVIYPLVYDRLREIANGHLFKERPDHTIQSTELVNLAYLKMVKQEEATFHNRSHFLAIASIAMRRILVSYARKRNAEKRGGKETPITFTDGMAARQAKIEELLDLDNALSKLETMNERQAKVVQYRFFGGLTYQEIAKVLGSTSDSVRYDWRVARAWLKRELDDG